MSSLLWHRSTPVTIIILSVMVATVLVTQCSVVVIANVHSDITISSSSPQTQSSSSSSSSSSLIPVASHHQNSSPPPLGTTLSHALELFNRHRSKRSTWEYTIDALKCTLKILSLQISRYHNNKLMCCGLWKIKSFMKNSANEVCEHPNETKQVFDTFINEELIYGKFSRSLLGDESLDCKAYEEGSAICDQFFSMLFVVLALFAISVVAMVVCAVCSILLCLNYRRNYYRLLKSKQLDDLDEKREFLHCCTLGGKSMLMKSDRMDSMAAAPPPPPPMSTSFKSGGRMTLKNIFTCGRVLPYCEQDHRHDIDHHLDAYRYRRSVDKGNNNDKMAHYSNNIGASSGSSKTSLSNTNSTNSSASNSNSNLFKSSKNKNISDPFVGRRSLVANNDASGGDIVPPVIADGVEPTDHRPLCVSSAAVDRCSSSASTETSTA